jgi:hypothetical protein
MGEPLWQGYLMLWARYGIRTIVLRRSCSQGLPQSMAFGIDVETFLTQRELREIVV